VDPRLGKEWKQAFDVGVAAHQYSDVSEAERELLSIFPREIAPDELANPSCDESCLTLLGIEMPVLDIRPLRAHLAFCNHLLWQPAPVTGDVAVRKRYDCRSTTEVILEGNGLYSGKRLRKILDVVDDRSTPA